MKDARGRANAAGEESVPIDPEATPVRWWHRPAARSTPLQKAGCLAVAAFALATSLGATPALAQQLAPEDQPALVEEADDSQAGSLASTSQDASPTGDGQATDGEAATVATDRERRPQVADGRAGSEESASVSLAAVYVADEEDREGDGQDDTNRGDDQGSSDGTEAVRQLVGEVVASIDADEPTICASSGSALSATGTALVSLATGDRLGSCAVRSQGGSSVSLAAGSTASARGLRAQAVVAQGAGSTVSLTDSSAYASGKDCVALAAEDGGAVTMEGGQLEATGGAVVRAEGAGSRVRLAQARVVSSGVFAELVGACGLELDATEAATTHGAAVFVAAGVPTIRLTNGSSITGTVVVAAGADLNLETDATSRLAGRIVRLEA